MKKSATRFLSFITFAAFYNSYINNNIDETVAPVVEDRTILDNIHTHVVSFILHIIRKRIENFILCCKNFTEFGTISIMIKKDSTRHSILFPQLFYRFRITFEIRC